MSKRRSTKTNTTALYLAAVVVIIVAFLLLGGGPWLRGMTHGNLPIGMSHWNWVHILISLGIGFVLGLVVARRKW